MSLSIHEFSTSGEADIALAADIERVLRAALEARGQAALAVSGGSTPRRLYERLSGLELDWSRISVVLADERWVEPGEAGSNESFIRAALLQNAAAHARFYPLKTSHSNPRAAAPAVSERLATCPLPFDVVVLGMGSDGHTLSWFPEASGLDAALEAQGPLAAPISAHPSAVTGAHPERLTLTRAALEGARFVALLIHGQEKASVLAEAQSPGAVTAMPVRALIRDPAIDLQVYAAPAPA
jgi:6-phosphogluconolactonase|tara:strand:- start:4821 stop:5540 length:720 start_codon:yes stop_codon:yes gene_type:complete